MADVTIASLRGGQVERQEPGDRLTCTVETSTGVATGGGFVEARTGAKIVDIAAPDSVSVVGFALHDAAADEIVTVATVGVFDIEADGAISAGDRVVVGTGGTTVAPLAVDVTATPTETTIEAAFTALRGVVGVALEDISNGETGRIRLTL